MDQWRTIFGKAGADIWTIIEQAIILAATDYPKEFKEKRSDIAETLFSRRLLQLHPGDTDATRLSGSVVTNATNRIEANETRDDEDETDLTRSEIRHEAGRHHCSYDETEALPDEMEEESLLMKELYSIKETIMNSDQSEKVLLDSLQRLEHMQITVEALKATEIGKQVNNLRKNSSKRVRSIVKQLVRSWKDLVDEWVKSAGEAAAAAIAGGCGTSEGDNEEQGLPSPPLDEDALLATRESLEMPQLLNNYMDDEITAGSGEAHCQEEEDLHVVSIKDNYFPSDLRTRSMQTDCSDYDAKASIRHNDRGIEVPEERGSSSRVDFSSFGRTERKPELSFRGLINQIVKDQRETDHFGRWSTTKSSTGGSGPGRPVTDVSKVRGSDTAGNSGLGKPANEVLKVKRSYDSQGDISHKDRSLKTSTLNKSTIVDEMQVAQRLEVAKRKLHEGYQLAENAKKQRTVQLMDLPDLPKGGPARGKVNLPAQNLAAFQNSHWNQNRR